MADHRAKYHLQCRWCSKDIEIAAKPEDVERWQNGMVIQNAMPYLSADDREMLISQTCGECWDKMFKEPAEDIAMEFFEATFDHKPSKEELVDSTQQQLIDGGADTIDGLVNRNIDIQKEHQNASGKWELRWKLKDLGT